MYIRKTFYCLLVVGAFLISHEGYAQVGGVPSGSIAVPILPQAFVDTSMPTQTGQTITVNAGGNFQTALNNAQPGDTIVLQAGATFTGNFTLPIKSNSNNKWIVIKSSNESQLPAPGIRVQPSNAANMPKIVTANTNYALSADRSAGYYRFIGVEVTDSGAPSQYGALFPDGTRGAYNYGVIELGRGGRDTQLSHLPHHIIFDRSYIHAQPKTSSRRGFAFNGAHLAIIDSYVSSFKEVGADTQAIGGWNGVGPFKIVNNYLEGAGENVMFGGASPSVPNLISSDIEIRGNYFYKPLTWKIGDPQYQGVAWTIKNLLETKNASRMLVEGNVFENSWAHAQTGWAMILRSANSGGGCTWGIGSHFTFPNNIIRNVGAGINIGTSQNTGTTAEPHHMLVENNIIENVAVAPFTGDNRGFQILGGGIADIIFRKNTLTGGSISAGLLMEPTTNNFEYTDNINTWGQYGVVKSGGTGESIIPTVVSGVLNYSGNVWIKPSSITSPFGSIFVTTLSAAEATGKGANRALVNQATQYAISGGGTYIPPTPPPTTTPAPTLALSASPTSITSGQSATLSWTSANATSCSGSGGWTGSKSLSGSQSVTPTTSTTYSLSCTGSGGTVTQSVAVSVTAPAIPPPSGSIPLPTLPQAFVDTTMPVQTGAIINVANNCTGLSNCQTNLQTALNSAQPGDTVVLKAGDTFNGSFSLPAKSNPNNKWIVVETSAKSNLPPQGTRVGISHKAFMPIIISPDISPSIKTNSGTNGWRFVGIEITISSSVTAVNYGIVQLGTTGAAQDTLAEVPYNLIIDRSYIHGQSTTQTTRCIALNSARSAIVDSLVTECHAVGYDSQAIWGGNGPGPFKIQNNLLEGSGENVMFGGSDPSIPNLVPSDIEIRGNYIHKPLTWKVGDPAYAGIHWTVKNLLEMKNSERLLIENNVFDGSWSDAQSGFPVIIRSSNQGGSCTWCRSAHVTIRRNYFTNVAGGISFTGEGDGGNSVIMHDGYAFENVIDNVGIAPFVGGSERIFMILGGGPSSVGPSNLTLERNVGAGNLLSTIYIDKNAPSQGVVFKDSVLEIGRYGAVGTSGTAEGIPSLDLGTPGYVWQNMYLVGSARNSYPPTTYFVATESGADPLATQIRSVVSSATVGAVTGNWGSGYVPPPFSAAPTLSFAASPISITAGQSATLSWTSTDASSCSASGGWSGTKAVSGSQSVTPTTNTTYTLSCTGSGGTTTQNATITVGSTTPPPSGTFLIGSWIQLTANTNVRSQPTTGATTVLGMEFSGSI